MEEKYIPSPNGRDCPQNGQHEDIECGCDECDYYMVCYKDLCNDITEYEMREAQNFLRNHDPSSKKQAEILIGAIILIIIVPIITFVLLHETCVPYFLDGLNSI